MRNYFFSPFFSLPIRKRGNYLFLYFYSFFPLSEKGGIIYLLPPLLSFQEGEDYFLPLSSPFPLGRKKIISPFFSSLFSLWKGGRFLPFSLPPSLWEEKRLFLPFSLPPSQREGGRLRRGIGIKIQEKLN